MSIAETMAWATKLAMQGKALLRPTATTEAAKQAGQNSASYAPYKTGKDAASPPASGEPVRSI